MTYRLIVRRQAKADIRAASRWYERQRSGLGRAFVQQVDLLLDRVRQNPLQYQFVHRGIRRAIPRSSPTVCSTASRGRTFSCLRWFTCIANHPRGRIANLGVKANNAFDQPAGSHSLAAAGQRER